MTNPPALPTGRQASTYPAILRGQLILPAYAPLRLKGIQQSWEKGDTGGFVFLIF